MTPSSSSGAAPTSASFCLDHRFGLPDTVEPGEVGSGWLVLDVAEDTETVTWEMVLPNRGLPFAVDVDE